MPRLKRQAKARPCQRQKSSFGFTLLEILVALIVLSIGLLGVAALQLRSLQNSHASYERSIASLQARDLVERMWAGICTLHDANGIIVPGRQAPIEAAWRADHTNTNTNPFASQGWNAVLGSPPTGTHVWTITIRWTGRNQGQEEVIVHHFRLPPPLRPDFCPQEG